MTIESFYSLPLGAQTGVIAFGIAIVLLAIAQAISIASYNARANVTSLDDIRRVVENLSMARSLASEENSGRLVIARQNPRPVRRAVHRTRKQSVAIQHSRMRNGLSPSWVDSYTVPLDFCLQND